MTPTGSDALFFLGEKHMIPMILYIRDHPGCRRIEIYNLIGRNPRSNAKLRMLVTNEDGMRTPHRHILGTTLHNKR